MGSELAGLGNRNPYRAGVHDPPIFAHSADYVEVLTPGIQTGWFYWVVAERVNVELSVDQGAIFCRIRRASNGC